MGIFVFATLNLLLAIDKTAQRLFAPSPSSYSSSSSPSPSLPRVAPRRELTSIDHLFLLLNKAFTVVFNHYLIVFLWNSDCVLWKSPDDPLGFAIKSTVLPFALLVVFDDVMYYWWHRCLHVGVLYKALHKHHHRELSPSRWSADATNAHPIEYAVTACFIPASVFLVGVTDSALQNLMQFGSFSCKPHALTVASFVLLNALLSAANHSRSDVSFGSLFSTRNHDTHHKRGAKGGNFAQFLWQIDWLMGTYVPWQCPASN